MIRRLAFEFAEKVGKETPFNKDMRKAGPHWLRSFLERHPELSIRQAEGLSIARAQGLNRGEVNKMFDLLLNVMTEHNLLDKPDKIFNIDETGVQLNNSTGKVIATRGARVVHSITSAEKGETLSVIACCNAVGNFLPPVVIIKGVNKKPEFQDGLPPGSEVYMNKKSAYVNAELFHRWLRDHFVPRKPQGKVILLLDGHSSHTNAIEMLETAEQNDIILFCLPSHTTQALQPLDRSFFKPFKTFYTAETRNWMISHKDRKISRLVAGRLIGNAWTKAATTSNAISGFRACGIYPFDPSAIPEHFFAISDSSTNNRGSIEDNPVHQNEEDLEQEPGPSTRTFPVRNHHPSRGTDSEIMELTVSNTPSNSPHSPNTSPPIMSQNNNSVNTTTNGAGEETPSKYLQECSPVPKIPVPFYKRAKQSAAILNTKENIESKRAATKGKATPNITCKNKPPKSRIGIEKMKGTSKASKKRPRKVSSSSDESMSSISDGTDESHPSDDSNKDSECKECFETYSTTKSNADWVQCLMCKNWLHEDCTMYGDYCNKCGHMKRFNSRKLKKKM